jgi:pimeloyl-ACP methyl ester carboxylesterase
MTDITGHYVDVDETRIYYEEAGEGDPIVCVHTAGANCLEWRFVLPKLAEEGYRGIALDLPGHAHSYPVDWEPIRDMHEYAEFVWDFTRTIVPDDEPIMTGCSIGGDMMLDLAAHHSDECRAIIAMEGAAHTPTFPDVSELENPAAAPGWQDAMERAAIESINEDASDELVTEARWMHRNAQISAVADLESWTSQDVRGQLDNIGCPVLVVKGDEDFYVPEELVKETVAEMPDNLGESLILDGVGHYPMMEAPNRFIEFATDFLDRHEEPRAASD